MGFEFPRKRDEIRQVLEDVKPRIIESRNSDRFPRVEKQIRDCSHCNLRGSIEIDLSPEVPLAARGKTWRTKGKNEECL